MIAAAALVAQSRTLAVVTVEIVEPQDRVPAVLYAETQFRARLMVGGEDHTAEATFSWIFDGGEPAQAVGNPVPVGFEDPGTHLVQVTGHYQGQQGVTIESIRAIGGAPTIDNCGDFFFWHAPHNQPTYRFHGRPGQPGGTQYEWLFNYGADKVEVIGAPTNLDLEVKPIHSSEVIGDVFPVLFYTLGNTHLGYESMATIHKPTVPYSKRWINAEDDDHKNGPTDPQYSYQEWIAYACFSQFCLAMEGMTWHEEIGYYPDSPVQSGVKLGDSLVPANGRVWDKWGMHSDDPWPDPPPVMRLHCAQYVWIGGWHGEDQHNNPFWLTERTDWSTPDIVIDPLDGHD